MKLLVFILKLFIFFLLSVMIVSAQKVVNGDLRDYYTVLEPHYSAGHQSNYFDTIYEPVAVESGWKMTYLVDDTLCKSNNCIIYKPFELFHGYFSYSNLLFQYSSPLVKDSVYEIQVDFKRHFTDSKNVPPHPGMGLCISMECSELSTAYVASSTSRDRAYCYKFYPFEWSQLNARKWQSAVIEYKADGGEMCLHLGVLPRIQEKRYVTEQKWVTRQAQKYKDKRTAKAKKRIVSRLREYFPFWNSIHLSDDELVEISLKVQSQDLIDAAYIIDCVSIRMMK